MLLPLPRAYRGGQVTKLVMVACCLLAVDIGTMPLGGQYVECWPPDIATHLFGSLKIVTVAVTVAVTAAVPDGECFGGA
jgi:hypothetical protein